MVMAKAPGKLYLAGEYAVTLPGQPSIIMAVNRFVTVNLDPRTVQASDGPQWRKTAGLR